jgi:hypothetical protein
MQVLMVTEAADLVTSLTMLPLALEDNSSINNATVMMDFEFSRYINKKHMH